jgi:hypothetical protein
MTANDEPVRPVDTSAANRRSEADYRRTRRLHARRRTLRRRRLVAGIALVVVVAVAVGLLSGGSASRSGSASLGGGTPARQTSSAARQPHPAALRTSASPPAKHVHRLSPSPGSLPQTRAYPSGDSSQFRSLMRSLWDGIVRGSVEPALAAFFPRGAYLQLKTIASAGSDWTDRLVHDYALDIAAAHALLGRNAALARLLRVAVPSTYGHWIPPGVCDNSIGYYEMPNARVVYSEGGEVRSFAIASMISWRGVWYVVHLGAILRSADSGVVDEPTSGPGMSPYSGTC